MPLEEDVMKSMVETGRQLKQDLWSASDLEVLRQRAKDLCGLESKARAAADPQRKAQYQLAADLVVQHVQLLALTRLTVSEAHVIDAMTALLKKALVAALSKYLPAVIASH